MIQLQRYDVLAVRAAINALVIAWARTPKGRRKVLEAIAILQAEAMRSQVVPMCKKERVSRELLDEGVLYLEDLRAMIDEKQV